MRLTLSPTASIFLPSSSMSRCKQSTLDLTFPSWSRISTLLMVWVRLRSARTASRRGRSTSSAASSALRIMQLPSGALPLAWSGQGSAAVMRAMASRPIWLLPRSGSPVISVSLRRAMRPDHSQSIGRGSISAMLTRVI
jgi:hypothetical protein